MGTVYCLEPGTYLKKDHQAFQIYRDDRLYTGIPVAHVDRLVVAQRTSVSTGVLIQCLREGIPVHFLSSTGRYLGLLQPNHQKNSPLRDTQYRIAFDDTRRLQWSCRIVEQKIRNMRSLLRQWSDAFPDWIQKLTEMIPLVDRAETLTQLRGYEGVASRYLFEAYRVILPDKWNFTRRAKHPPPDPPNAVMSLCYTMLFSQVYEAVVTAGFDPFRGWFHDTSYGHPAFVSDCCELYRSVVADPVISEVLRREDISPENFLHAGKKDGEQSGTTGQGVQADDTTFREIIRTMEGRFEALRTIDDRTLTLRQWIRDDILRLAQAATSETEWKPARLRR